MQRCIRCPASQLVGLRFSWIQRSSVCLRPNVKNLQEAFRRRGNSFHTCTSVRRQHQNVQVSPLEETPAPDSRWPSRPEQPESGTFSFYGWRLGASACVSSVPAQGAGPSSSVSVRLTSSISDMRLQQHAEPSGANRIRAVCCD